MKHLSKSAAIFALAVTVLICANAATNVAAFDQKIGENALAPQAPPTYRHRPVLEFFTGLSCPSCMAGPHPDMEKMWNESGYNPEQPFTYIAFHELNGGGVDDLWTADGEERMRFYQPGVSGTPDGEFDGGYIELGGMANNDGIDYNSAKGAITTCTNRGQTTINPIHPIQSMRNGFKFVNLQVQQVFTGDGFAITVKAAYLGTSALIETKALNGLLYVFIVEDNVTAYSKVEKQDVNNHNAFRGYAIKAKSFSLKNGEDTDFSGQWTIPTDAKLPVNPANIQAIAVVYDADDTTSENGNQGNRAGVPRAIQSATPMSTAFDLKNDIPRATNVKVTASGGKLKLTASLDDSAGIAMAYLVYNKQRANATNWSVEKMNVTGSECEGDTCSVYKDATGTAYISAAMDENLYAILLIYDGNGTQGRVELMNLTAGKPRAGSGFGNIPVPVLGAAAGVIAVVAGVWYWRRKKAVDTAA